MHICRKEPCFPSPFIDSPKSGMLRARKMYRKRDINHWFPFIITYCVLLKARQFTRITTPLCWCCSLFFVILCKGAIYSSNKSSWQLSQICHRSLVTGSTLKIASALILWPIHMVYQDSIRVKSLRGYVSWYWRRRWSRGELAGLFLYTLEMKYPRMDKIERELYTTDKGLKDNWFDHWALWHSKTSHLTPFYLPLCFVIKHDMDAMAHAQCVHSASPTFPPPFTFHSNFLSLMHTKLPKEDATVLLRLVSSIPVSSPSRLDNYEDEEALFHRNLKREVEDVHLPPRIPEFKYWALIFKYKHHPLFQCTGLFEML